MTPTAFPRRLALRAAVALSLLAALLLPANARQKATSPTEGRTVTVRGKRLYVEDIGPRDAPVLLYVHGGPGAGSYDFMKLQGARLARDFRVIAYDQRGVLRSEALTADEPFGMRELVEDVEALRIALGVKSWSVLGHSFGGIVAMRYVLAYPRSVERALFECPVFDMETSSRSMLRAAAVELEAMGKAARAAEVRAIADRGTGREPFDAVMGVFGDLGDRRDNLYVHGPDKKFFDRIVAESGLAPELWRKTAGPFTRKIFADPLLHENLMPRLREVSVPALLMVGRYDPVCAPEQIAAFRRDVRRGRVEVFAQSGHFPRFEEPERYAEVVTAFLRSGKRR